MPLSKKLRPSQTDMERGVRASLPEQPKGIEPAESESKITIEGQPIRVIPVASIPTRQIRPNQVTMGTVMVPPDQATQIVGQDPARQRLIVRAVEATSVYLGAHPNVGPNNGFYLGRTDGSADDVMVVEFTHTQALYAWHSLGGPTRISWFAETIAPTYLDQFERGTE